MIRKFKALGLAVVAVLAMSAVVTSAAQAQFTASAYPATVTATSALGNGVFTVDHSSVECAGHFEGTSQAPSTTLTVNATYTNCKAFSFASATVNMNGCAYVFHDVGDNSKGQVTVECPAGKVVTIVAGNCEVQVGAQGPLSSVSYTNNGPHINMQANVSGITANRTKDGFLCPLTGTGHVSNATYKQTNSVTVVRIGGGSLSVD